VGFVCVSVCLPVSYSGVCVSVYRIVGFVCLFVLYSGVCVSVCLSVSYSGVCVSVYRIVGLCVCLYRIV